MLPGKTYTLREIGRILLRRSWLILLSLALGTAAGILAYARLPVQYQSETRIMVLPGRTQDSAVASAVSIDLEDRLRSISEQTLSGSALERIVQDFHLYKEQRATGIEMNDVVKRLRSDIDVTLEGNGPSFRVTYVAPDAKLAQKVTERLAALYAAENLADRETPTGGTSGALESELQDAKQRLIEQEKQVEEYRSRDAGQRPSELQRNLQLLLNAQTQWHSLDESMQRTRERRLLVERQIGEAQAPSVDVVMPGVAVPSAEGPVAGGTAQAPDAPNTAPPSEMDRQRRLNDLQAELKLTDVDLKAGQEHAGRLKSKIADYQARLDAVPTRESELVQLTRDYSTRLETYSNLLLKREDSMRASQLKPRQIGPQFRILDHASLPLRPQNQRKRQELPVAGGVGGFVLGLLLVGFLEYRDSTFKCEDDVHRVLSVPVLALIPVMESARDGPWIAGGGDRAGP